MIHFTKMHGLGNDYIYINFLQKENQILPEEIPKFTRYICNRHFGVGADGIILIKKSSIADLKMEIYNSDGSQAQMCGNGIRCFGKYVYEKGIIRKKHLKIETLAGIRELSLKVEKEEVTEVTVNMGKAIWKNKTPTILQVLDKKIEGMQVSMGNPHFVILTKKIETVEIEKYGKNIETNPIFPERTNVEFIEVQGNSSIKMRVWERGTGETYACGTGACAAFAVCYEKQLVKSEVTVYLKGGELNIKLNPLTDEIYMTGLATKICDGTF